MNHSPLTPSLRYLYYILYTSYAIRNTLYGIRSLLRFLTPKLNIWTWLFCVLSIFLFSFFFLFLKLPFPFFSSSPGDDPIAYWKFDEGQGNIAYDSAGNNNGTLAAGNSAPSWMSEDNCISGKCLYFDGTNDYVSIPDNSNLSPGSGDHSVLTFIKTTKDHTNTAWIYSNYGSNTNNLVGLSLTSNDVPRCYYRDGSGNAATALGNTTVNDGNWHHRGCILSGSSVYIYVDGVLEQTADASSVGTIITTGMAKTIATYAPTPGGQSFKGFIDELKIYNYARTVDQIKADYAARGTTKGVSARLGESDLSKKLSAGLVGYWKMDENTGTTVVDASGNNNTGTLGSGSSAPTWTGGKYGSGLNFDGSGDYVDVGNQAALNMTGSRTISAWIKPTILREETIFSKYRWNYGLWINSSNGMLQGYVAKIAGDSNGAAHSLTTAGAISVDSWQFVTMTFNMETDKKIRIYVNGIEQQYSEQVPLDATQSSTFSQNAAIGASFGIANIYSFSGQLDEVRIYNRALDPSEVQALYEYSPGPVGWWKMDEGSWNGTTGEVKDSSGNNLNGTRSGNTTTTAGKIGRAGKFDGAGDYINIGDLDILEPKHLTLSFWAKTNDYNRSTNGGIAKGNIFGSASEISYRINFFNNEAIATIVMQSGSIESVSNIPIGDNNWHYWSITYDGTKLAFYKDGVLVGTNAATGNIDYDQSVNDFVIGARKNGQYSFDGLIDDVKIYNYARTQEQILQDMNGSSHATESRLSSDMTVLHLKMDEGYGNTVYDHSPQKNNGTLGAGNSAPTWTNEGKFGKALSFDSNDYAIVNHDFNSDDASIVFWFKSPGAGSRWLVNKFTNTNFSWGVKQSNNILTIYDDIGSDDLEYYPTTFLANQWHHVVAIHKHSENLLFLNGKLVGSGAISEGNFNSFSSSSFYIGARFPGNGGFTGLIDEVKIYPFALTDEQVKQDYNQGQAVVMGATSTGVGGTAPSSAASAEYCVPGDSSFCSPPVGEWKFEAIGGTAVYDTSGNNNTGTMINGPVPVQGKVGKALRFDGVDDYVNINTDIPPVNNSLTFSVWVKPDIVTNGSILAKNSCSTQAPSCGFFLTYTPTEKFVFY
ncbi:MAG TPA: LamG domain-containing protein, partial [Candidatus Woesebacteria bacterium]|nr:LamG domain-containing protein [Candidatus Woesebacteria bacterium]